jgi:Lrp/AsnC family leucine-responsive transcriptional regulator
LTPGSDKLLDKIGWRILSELQANGRLPLTELGRRVGLSTPAVGERVRRLEDVGIITGYRAQVDHAKVGYPILAFIRISVVGDFLSRVMKVSREVPEVLECHRVTGSDSYLIKAIAGSIEELEKVIDRFTPYVATTTAIVLSSVVTSGVIEPKPIPGDRRRGRGNGNQRAASSADGAR